MAVLMGSERVAKHKSGEGREYLSDTQLEILILALRGNMDMSKYLMIRYIVTCTLGAKNNLDTF